MYITTRMFILSLLIAVSLGLIQSWVEDKNIFEFNYFIPFFWYWIGWGLADLYSAWKGRS